MAFTLYCIASLPSISISQPATAATSLSVSGGLEVAAGPLSVTAAAGALSMLGDAESAGGDLSPQADRASTHATDNKLSFMFMKTPEADSEAHCERNGSCTH
ncbi:hypothetical protein GCM10027266_25780 [Arenimonas alkanexedens]